MASTCVPKTRRRLPHLRIRRVCGALCFLGLSHILSAQTRSAAHPLDALSKDEIVATVAVLKAQGKITENTRFSLIELKEPPKDEVVGFRSGGPTRREALVVVYQRASNRTFEVLVDLQAKAIISWKEIPDVQPSLLEDDAKILEQAIRADVRWQESMKKRGITDLENVVIIDWAGGYFRLPDEEGFRFERGASYYRGSAKGVALRPVEGVVAYVVVWLFDRFDRKPPTAAKLAPPHTAPHKLGH